MIERAAIPDPGRGEDRMFLDLAAGDLVLLARLHERELTGDLLAELRKRPFAAQMALAPDDEEGRAAFAVLDAALASEECDGSPAAMDRLAADFAAIYLNHTWSVSPCESVWVDPEGLVLQEAMFEIRRWYHHYGLAAANWRMMSDDHLVQQLRFIAHLLAHEIDHAPKDAAAFADHHVLRWVEPFAARVAQRCQTQFYAGLALVTAVTLKRLRRLLVAVAGMPLIELEPIEEEKQRRREDAAKRASEAYFPGAAPSW